MQCPTALTGKRGEDVAAAYLRGSGYRIVERNVRFGRYEIDIVAEDLRRDMLVFVEVKARSTSDPRYPLRTAVDAKKRRALRSAVARFVVARSYDGAARIDVVCVDGERVTEHVVDFGSEWY